MSATLTDFLQAPPPQPPPAPTSPWRGVGMTWTGPDGSVWDLLADDAPVLLRAVRGLHLPKWRRWTSSSPAVPGDRSRGAIAEGRDVTWTVAVRSREGSDAFVELDEAWWSSLDPERAGTWSVTYGDLTRTMRLTLDSSVDDMPRDPTYRGEALYQLALRSDSPFWRGRDITAEFTAASASAGFFSTSGSVFTIVPSNTLASAAVDNQGDEPTWPVYTIPGPCTSVAVGVAGRLVELGTIGSGQVRVIDTSPDAQTVVDAAGVDRSSDVTGADFAPIPPGKNVPLNFSVVGAGFGFGVGVAAPTWYRRGWGTR